MPRFDISNWFDLPFLAFHTESDQISLGWGQHHMWPCRWVSGTPSLKKNMTSNKRPSYSYSYKRIACVACNAAHIVLVPSKPHISFFAPRLCPAVLHQPISRPGVFVNAVSNNENGVVVSFVAAFFFPVDSSLVMVKRLETGINWNAARALVDISN